MTVDKLHVPLWLRLAANGLASATIAGVISYVSWLLGTPQGWALLEGVVALALYWLMWLGSLDDPRNS